MSFSRNLAALCAAVVRVVELPSRDHRVPASRQPEKPGNPRMSAYSVAAAGPTGALATSGSVEVAGTPFESYHGRAA